MVDKTTPDKPVAPPRPAPARPPEPALAAAPGVVLVAEDEHLLARSLQNDLSELGFEVVGPARNGKEAVDLARQRRPDLALLDIRMPEMDGLAAAEVLFGEMGVPVVILSAYSDTCYVEAGARIGVFGYLLKPVGLDELRVTLAVAWSRFTRQAELSGEVERANRKLEERKVIEKAKGLLMKTRGVDEEEAMRTLQRQARDARRPMAEVARSLLDMHSPFDGAPAATPAPPTPSPGGP